MDTGIDALWAAKALLGSQDALAKAVGVSQPSVHGVLKKSRPVPAEWCSKIEKATNGKITRHQLRPDLWPEEIDAA